MVLSEHDNLSDETTLSTTSYTYGAIVSMFISVNIFFVISFGIINWVTSQSLKNS